jgi:Ca2+-binding RTX toxin-like protein
MSASGTQVGSLSASGGAGGYSFSLVDSAGGRFAISSGRLVATSIALNFEAAASHNVRIKVTDSGGRTSEETFGITVSDRNDAPTALNVSNQVTLAQNTTVETKVADLAVIDEDTASQFRSYGFSVDDARFLVRDNALFLKAGQSLDAASEPSIALKITLMDGAFTLVRDVAVAVSTTGGGGGGTPTGTTGTEGDDRGATALVGTDNGETMNGLGGHDELFGKGGADTLNGGNGNDVLVGGAGADVLDGGAGQDAASYADAGAGVKVSLAKPAENTGDARGDSFVSIEDIFGSLHDDNLSGNNSANVLRGGEGADRLSGQGGTDQLFGDAGHDMLFGQGGNDTLNGGAGDDILAGGSGGRDWFVFQGDWGADQVTDFEDGVDFLDLRGNGLTFADLAISQDGSHALVSAGAGFGTVLVQNIAVGSLTQSDFLFV